MMKRLLAVMLGSLILPGIVQAATGKNQMESYLKGFTTLQASFKQTLTDEKGKMLELSNGEVYLQRPGKFRWNYLKPYQQSIIADGQKVWIYDKELKQITVKPLQKALGSTPALLLNGDVKVEREFKLTELGQQAGLEWVSLKPWSESQYVDIRLGFKDNSLYAMELKDNFAQTTRIDFSGEKRNGKIDPALFDFKPPAGVDVINTEKTP